MKKIIIASIALALPTLIQAAPLTPEQALARLGADGKQKAGAFSKGEIRLTHTEKTPAGNVAIYLFDRPGAGFLVVSADDAVKPLLGYSDTGSLSGTLPEPLQYWLGEYARQIEFASTNTRRAPEGDVITIDRPEREPIVPMIKTQWDQDAPYYNMCPMYGVDRTYTGCVATAMAQVMNYWQYPEKGKGSISYDAESIQKRLSLDFSLRKFDWENMLDTYNDGDYTDAQANAVAYLMKACGYAVKMDYGVDSSGALSMLIPRAFKKYFGYDESCRQTMRQYFTLSEWEELIYNELQNVGPVLYGGGSMIGGGHSFICDGYDKDGYFHFNWGWKGMSNGYFLLDALNPYDVGIGGGNGGGYNFTQDVIIGIQPPTGEEYIPEPITLSQNGSFAGYIKDGVLYFDLFAEEGAMFVNYEPSKLKLQLGVIVEAVDNPDFTSYGVAMSDIHFALEPGYGTTPSAFGGGINLEAQNLPDGTYKLTSAILLDDEGSEWTPTRPGRDYFNYIYLHRNGNKYTVEVEDVDRLEVRDGGVRGELYFGTNAKVYVSVHNYADHEMSRGFAPCVIINGEPVMLGESIFLTVPAGATVEREWTTPMYTLNPYFSVSEDTKAVFTFFDESTYNFFDQDLRKNITLHPNPGPPTIRTVQSPVIENGIKRPATGPVIMQGNPTYDIGDPAEIKVLAKIALDEGYFAYPVYAVIIDPNGDYTVEEYNGHEVYFDAPGEMEFRTSVAFPAAEELKRYTIMIGFAYGSNLYQIPKHVCDFVYDSAFAGVDGVTDEASSLRYIGDVLYGNGEISVYDAGGRLVARGCDKVATSSLSSGVYVARNAEASLKIIR